MAKRALVPVERSSRGEAVEILRLAKQQVAGFTTWHQADIGRHPQLPDVFRGAWPEQAKLGRAECQRFLGANRRALHLAGGRVHAGGYVHREHEQPLGVDLRNDLHPVRVERPVEPDTKQAIDNERRGGVEIEREFLARLGRVGDAEQTDLSLRQMPGHGAHIIAVVALAGEQQDGIAGPGEFHHTVRNYLADLGDDFLLGFAGLPRRRLPATHLLHGDHRQWHDSGSVVRPPGGNKRPLAKRLVRRLGKDCAGVGWV